MHLRLDPALCRDCQACALACSLYHFGQCSPELARLRIEKDMAAYRFEIRICRGCPAPECVAACPSEAIRAEEGGRIALDEGACTQCGLCAEACPYGAIFYSAALGRYLVCDRCGGRAGGPLCAELCPVGALALSTEPALEA